MYDVADVSVIMFMCLTFSRKPCHIKADTCQRTSDSSSLIPSFYLKIGDVKFVTPIYLKCYNGRNNKRGKFRHSQNHPTSSDLFSVGSDDSIQI